MKVAWLLGLRRLGGKILAGFLRWSFRNNCGYKRPTKPRQRVTVPFGAQEMDLKLAETSG